MRILVGNAPDSWGVWFPSDEKQTPWHRFLDEVAEAGYEWIELGPYGYLPTELATLRHELDTRGLKVTGSAVEGNLADPEAWPMLAEQLYGVGPLLADLGAKYLVLIDDSYTDLNSGELIAPAQLDEDGWRRLIDTTNKVAEIARDRFGLTLTFHPNVETHVEHESQIEALFDSTDPDLVSLCLDIGHHAYLGGDPVAFMRKHHKRIPYLHLKNVDGEVLAQVKAESISFAKAVGMGVMCEPVEGIVDFLAFRDVLREIDFDGWAIVEQDMYPTPFDRPLPIAKRARAYLREIGIG